MGNCFLERNCRQTIKYTKSMFRFIEIIGKGAFGQVWKVQMKQSQEIFALKVIDKAKLISKKSVKLILQEKLILETLACQRSDFIVNIKGTFQDRDKVYILTQYISGRPLQDYINRKDISFTEVEVCFFVRKLFQILRYLQSKKIIHGDIKPSNIIIDEFGLPHLVDFGTAAFLQSNNSHQNGGTLPYMAPEVILGLNHNYSIDYYAVGIVAFQLFFKQRPFTGLTTKQLRQKILCKQMNSQNYMNLRSLSQNASDFIIQILNKQRNDRLGNKGIQEIFSHPWLISNHLMTQRPNINRFNNIFQSSKSKHKNNIKYTETKAPTIKQIDKILQKPHIQQMFKAFDQPSQLKQRQANKKRRKYSIA